MTHFTRFAAALALIIVAAAGTGTRESTAQTAPSPYPTPTPMMTPGPMTTPMPMSSPMPLSSPPMVPSPSPSASMLADDKPPENPLITDRVRTEFAAWQRGQIDRKTYSPYAGGTYDPSYVAIVQPYLAIGPAQTVAYRSASLLLGDLVYTYDIAGANGSVSVVYSLDAGGRTDGIVFTPLIFRPAESGK